MRVVVFSLMALFVSSAAFGQVIIEEFDEPEEEGEIFDCPIVEACKEECAVGFDFCIVSFDPSPFSACMFELYAALDDCRARFPEGQGRDRCLEVVGRREQTRCAGLAGYDVCNDWRQECLADCDAMEVVEPPVCPPE